VDLFSALLTPLIAIVMTYIAIQQYRANQLKLRHDLYDRRLLPYNAVAEFLPHVMREGTADRAQLVTLLQKTRESYFLFGKEISDYGGASRRIRGAYAFSYGRVVHSTPGAARKLIVPRSASAYSGLLIDLFDADQVFAFPADIRSNQENAVHM